MNWKDEPTIITELNSNVDYVMTIDENGTSSNFKTLFDKVKRGETLSNNDRFFVLTGVILKRDELVKFYNQINQIKDKYWNNGCWFNTKKNRTEKVHFHVNEFRSYTNRKNAFRELISRDIYDNFISDISDLIKVTEFKVISANFCIQTMGRKYSTPYNPYILGMHFLIERYVFFLNTVSKNGIIVLESRASDNTSKQDNYVHQKTVEFLSTGKTTYTTYDTTIFNNIAGVYFNPKLSIEDNYLKSYPSIELADLASYPIYKRFKNSSYNGRDWQLIETKFYKYPSYDGRGLKIFPNRSDIDYYTFINNLLS